MQKSLRCGLSLFFVFLFLSPVWILTDLPKAQAQETDIFQHPNIENADIKKTFPNKLGLDVETSKLLVHRFTLLGEIHFAPFMTNLFQRKLTISQGMGPRNGDGFWRYQC